MSDFVLLPTIGASGYYSLNAPFNTKVAEAERYTCQAIRRLSDYIANNEDPLNTIYLANGLTEAHYDEDVNKNQYIISLQSALGHWLYVPAQYLLKYPDLNGVPYRSLMIGLSLPALPVDQTLDHTLLLLQNIITDTLGVQSQSKVVELSRTVMLSHDRHIQLTANRNNNITNQITDRSRYLKALDDLNTCYLKIQELEQYILTHS